MAATTERSSPEECANCGADIPRGAKSCPECGADERTGWRETNVYDDVDLPEESWREDASDAVPGKSVAAQRAVNGIAWYWWCVGIALVVLLALGALRLL